MVLLSRTSHIQQPQGPVEIDWAHPLTRGLVFFQIPSMARAPDLVGGAQSTSFGSATLGVGKGGVGVRATTFNDGWGTTCSPSVFQITTQYTIATRLDITNQVAYSKVLTIPYHTGSWTNPYPAIGIARNASTTQFNIEQAISTSAYGSATFPTNTFVVGNDINYVAVRDGSTAFLLRNGTQYSPSVTSTITTPVLWGTGNHLAVLNRNMNAPGEGTQGTCYYAALWNRALSSSEARDFQNNPYQIIKPHRRILFFTAGTTPHTISGGMASKKPEISGSLSQGEISPHSLLGNLLSPKPIMGGDLTQTLTGRFFSGALVSPKPIVSGTLTQSFPARSISGGLLSNKPTVAGTLTQSVISPHDISGGLVSPKPILGGTLTQTLGLFTDEFTDEFDKTPLSSVGTFSGALVSPKPIVGGTLTQSFPARSVSGAIVSPKPIAAGTLTQSAMAPHAISGGLVTQKPTAVGTLTQSAIAPHTISGGLVSKKPIVSGVLTQSAIAPHSASGGMVSAKPQISGILYQGGIASHALLGGLVSPKPVVSGNLTQTFPARSISGGLVSAKPRMSGDMTQTFPARSISGSLASSKPIMSGQLFQGALFGYEFAGGLISPKPVIGGSLTQTLFPSNISGSLISAKPRIVGTLTQTPLDNFFAGALVSPKPKIVGLIAQGEIGASSFSAVLVSPKPRVSGSLTQSAIAARTFSGSLISLKPRITGTLVQQALNGFDFSGGLISRKPRVLGTLTQTFPARFISGGMVSKKPTITASLTQTRLPHAIAGGMVSPRSRLSGNFIQNLLTPHVISGGMVSPKPRIKAVKVADEYAVKAGIEYAAKGQLSLASGYLLLLVTDPEGETPMAHPMAIAQRTVEAGYGANPLVFEGPLDPAELKYFTVTWDTELQAAMDSIVPDNGTIEGQSVFLTLSEPAVATGIQVHAFSQDERSVTFWLKVEASQRGRTQWSGAGELHVITIRIITVRGQVFERDISFRVKQL